MTTLTLPTTIELADVTFPISRPHSFGLVIDTPMDAISKQAADDYLHELLLAPAHREAFFSLVEAEGLVVCRNVHSLAPSYRKVRGKSSAMKLSQAEYYHHDGCSSPTKPRIVEIRCPHQAVTRSITTAIAPFPAVIRAMLTALPEALLTDPSLVSARDAFANAELKLQHRERPDPASLEPEQWDLIQGKVTRLVRRELDAEGCRDYFRHVDTLANAYVLPWQMGESRLMLNSHVDLTRTLQHRRAYQKPRGETSEQNGSLVKRWPAEELDVAARSSSIARADRN